MKKVFKVIKDIFFKVFGKAWWFIVAAVVFFVIAVTPAFNPGLYVYTQGIRNETDDGFLKEFYLHDADNFSINSSGKAVVNSLTAGNNMEATLDFNTGETLFSNIDQVNVDISEDDYSIVVNDNSMEIEYKNSYDSVEDYYDAYFDEGSIADTTQKESGDYEIDGDEIVAVMEL